MSVLGAIVANACVEETATDAPFAMRKLDAVLLHRPDKAPDTDRVTYSMLFQFGTTG